MSDETPPKSPYLNYTEEEILATEKGIFVIQIGADLFSHNGKMGFTKDRAEQFYDNIVMGLEDLRENGTDIEKEDAFACLCNLRIMPLKIH
jgi:hypothetical protein